MPINPQKLRHRLEDAGFEPRVATALSEVIAELHDKKRASEGDSAQIATFHDLEAFKREFKLALVIQALAITLVVTTLLRLLP